MFLVHCMATFLVRTMPASSMAKPAAIHITRKPPIKKSSVFMMYLPSAGRVVAASWAAAGLMSRAARAAAGSTAASLRR